MRTTHSNTDLLDKPRNGAHRGKSTKEPAITQASLDRVSAWTLRTGEELGLVEHRRHAAHIFGFKLRRESGLGAVGTVEIEEASLPVAFEVELDVSEAAVATSISDGFRLYKNTRKNSRM
jgi:hypothetical protein